MIKDLCFEIIQQCPNECIFCSSNSGYVCTTVISYETFERVINSLHSAYGIAEVSLSGGEPLLHRDILRMVTKLTSCGIKSRLYTSGVILNETINTDNLDWATLRIVEQLNRRKFMEVSVQKFAELKQAGLGTVVLSLHASEEETYNSLMGTQGQCINTLNSLLNARRAGLNVEVHYVPMRINKNEFEDVLELCDIAEIETLSVLKLVPQGRACNHLAALVLSESQLQEIRVLVDTVKCKYKTKVRLGLPLSGSGHDCTAGYDKFSIRYDGQVFPCVAFKNCTKDTSKFFKSTNIFETMEGFKPVARKSGCQMCQEIYK